MTIELGFAPTLEQERIFPMAPEVLENFIQQNKVAIKPENLIDRCIDGRYRYDDTSNFAAIAKPGSSAGDVVLVFGAVNRLQKQLPNQTILDTVIKSLGGVQNFTFHTEQKAVDENLEHGMGCGHLKHARNNTEDYGVTSDQMEFLFSKLPELLGQGAVEEILQGEHRESDVLLVESDEYSLKPQWENGEKHEEVFVYQSSLHGRQLGKLAKLLQEAYAETGQVVEESELRLALDQTFGLQLGASAKRLAKGLPMYNVKLSGDDIEIQ